MASQASEVKVWQIGVIVAALLLGAGAVYYVFFTEERSQLASSVWMADVNTGQLFERPVNQPGATIPAMNPKSKQRTLLPVVKDESGEWVLAERYRGSLSEIAGDHAAVPDPATGKVRVKKE